MRLLALALFAMSVGAQSIPEHDLSLRVTTEATDVEFGKAFALTVVRVWSKDLAPEEWDAAVLAPLVVQLEDTVRREDASRIEETRRYVCHAFERDTVTLPAVTWRARQVTGGPDRETSSEELVLRVASALPTTGPGTVELPGEPFPAPFAWLRWSVLGIALIATTSLAFWYVRHRLASGAGAPVVAPHEAALERLTRLREREPENLAEQYLDAVEASSLVRIFIERQFGVHAPEMTTEEFLTDARTAVALHDAQRGLLADFLTHCDLVKFARHAPARAERARLLDAVEEFVIGTTRPDGEEGA